MLRVRMVVRSRCCRPSHQLSLSIIHAFQFSVSDAWVVNCFCAMSWDVYMTVIFPTPPPPKHLLYRTALKRHQTRCVRFFVARCMFIYMRFAMCQAICGPHNELLLMGVERITYILWATQTACWQKCVNHYPSLLSSSPHRK